jgi:neutral ceramidase
VADQTLRAGLGVCEITPPVGIELGGFGFRTEPSAGVHTPLFARTLIFQNGGETIAITSCELLHLSGEQKGKILDRVGASVPLTRSNWMLACTHTHAGPEIFYFFQAKRVDPDYMDSLFDRIAESIRGAFADLQPVTVSSGSVEVDGIAVNRHIVNEDGKAAYECWLPNEGGLVDNRVCLLKVDTAKGEPFAVLSNFTCHPVTVAEKGEPTSRLISGDFPAIAAQRLRDETGYEVVYTTGCAGDINPHGICSGPATAEKHGEKFAEVVGKALASMRALENTELSHVLEDLTAEYESYPTREEFRDALLENERLFLVADPDLTIEQRYDGVTNIEWARRYLDLEERGEVFPGAPYPLQILRIGDYSIMAVPFEPFLEIGMKCQELLGADRSMVIAYANGNLGYLVPAQVHDEGGYEVARSYKCYGFPGPFRRDTAQRFYEFVERNQT